MLPGIPPRLILKSHQLLPQFLEIFSIEFQNKLSFTFVIHQMHVKLLERENLTNG